MPQKPAKFRIKDWMLCDVKSSCVLRAMPYVGKKDRPQVGVAEHLVVSLMEPYHKTGQNVTTDNYFTSLKTAKNFLRHNVTMVGALRKNKKEIPAELNVDTRQQALYTSGFLITQEHSIVLLYYKAKQKKDVFLLSSMHTTPVVNDNGAKKSQRRFCTITPPKVALIPLTNCCDVTVLKLHPDDGL